jgi:hypothetical protein
VGKLCDGAECCDLYVELGLPFFLAARSHQPSPPSFPNLTLSFLRARTKIEHSGYFSHGYCTAPLSGGGGF